MWEYRATLVLGLSLTLVNRLAGFVLPYVSTKVLIDRIVGQHRVDLMWPAAIATGVATLIQAGTSFAISQVISLAGQRAITVMRRTIQAKVLSLPVSFFDATQTGVLISRVMNDAEGIRNLIGTGIVQLLGGVVTAGIGIVGLFLSQLAPDAARAAVSGGVWWRDGVCVHAVAAHFFAESVARSPPRSPGV